MGLKIVEENLDLVDAQFHSLYTEQEGKYVLTGIDGMKTDADIARLNSALTKERNDHKAVKEKFAVLAGKDPSDVIAQLDRVAELEAQVEASKGKIDESKIETMVETRLKSKLAPLERELQTEKTRAEQLEAQNKQYVEKEKTLTIHSAIRKAASVANVRPEAVDDAIFLAERFFEINEDGSVIAKDIAGVTAGIDPAMWLNDLQGKKPHWWGDSIGGGAMGSGTGNFGGAGNPWSETHWNMTEQGKILSANPAKADQMAKAAGVNIGATKPYKK